MNKSWLRKRSKWGIRLVLIHLVLVVLITVSSNGVDLDCGVMGCLMSKNNVVFDLLNIPFAIILKVLLLKSKEFIQPAAI